MVGRNPSVRAEALMKRWQQALDAGESQKAAELCGEMITFAEQSGEIDHAKSVQMRLELAATMIRSAPEPRGKVTLSLPGDVLKALRLAAAETGKEMSEIASNALRHELELKKYRHASLALRKTK